MNRYTNTNQFVQTYKFTSIFLLVLFVASCHSKNEKTTIDRYALVNRHNITVEEFDPLASLTVGNGNFAFTTDFTGLQTFYKEYENGVSLGTMTNWGWHTFPNSNNYTIAESYKYYNVNGRKVPYQDQLRSSEQAIKAANYFRVNPHRLHLGIIRFLIKKENGEEISIADVKLPKHQLNLWEGKITSSFEIEGKSIQVEVFSHQEKDLISVSIKSPLIRSNQLAVEWIFPIWHR